MKKIFWQILVKGVLFVLLLLAKVQSGIFPFALAFLFAISLTEKEVLLNSFIFMLAGMTCFGYETLAYAVGALLLIIYFYAFAKKRKSLFLASMILFTAHAGFLAVQHWLPVLLTAALSVLFFIACMHFLQAVLTRKLRFSLSADEKVCAALFVVSLGAGIAGVQILGVWPALCIVSLLILLAVRLNGLPAGLTAAALLGSGFILAGESTAFMAGFCLWAALASVFRKNHKTFSALALVLGEVCLALFFTLYPIYSYINLAMVFLGAFSFVLLNDESELLVKLSQNLKAEETSLESLVGYSKAANYQKLFDISQVFFEMQKVFSDMQRPQMPVKEAQFMLASELKARLCADCPHKNICFRQNTAGEDGMVLLHNLMGQGIARGRLTLLDLPPHLTARCSRTNQLINEAGSLLLQYLSYSRSVSSENGTKALIAGQLAGLSEVLKNLAIEAKSRVVFNKSLEHEVLALLFDHNIHAVSGLVVEENERGKTVVLTLKDNDIDESVLAGLVSRACKMKMEVAHMQAGEDGLTHALLAACPGLNLTFGAACMPKSGQKESGDTHTLIKLAPGKFLLSLCDGMGSGPGANKIASQVVGLIENFYKAGFDSTAVLCNINKLLLAGSGENFSAVDAVVLNLFHGMADWMKLGAPVGFIKRSGSVTCIEAGALPIGIVEEASPKLTRVPVSKNDMLILLSDGISDAFSDKSKLSDFIGQSKTLNPQELADALLAAAVKKEGVPKDDMTVLVVRIF